MNFIYLFLLILFVNCSKKDNYINLRDGDIIFKNTTSEGLSGAINSVTQTSKETTYMHMGICFIQNDSVFVIHAAPEKGVCVELLHNFTHVNDTLHGKYDVYRLKNEFNNMIPNALDSAKSLVGKPYDEAYLLDNEAIYCSELIYQIFSGSKIFTLHPMTFKDPMSNEFHPTWVVHYEKLGMDIPEGQLGCNPNGMAAENSIVFVRSLH